jgi:hypothetical protein
MRADRGKKKKKGGMGGKKKKFIFSFEVISSSDNELIKHNGHD